MKMLKVILSLMIIVTLAVPPVYADEVAELKEMIQDMRQEYESRIQNLEAKIETLEKKRDDQVEAKVAEMRDDLKEEIKSASWSAHYDGRDHNATVGKGGMVVESPEGMTKVSVGGYMDHEFEDFKNKKSTFDQHHWIINIGAQLGERLRFFSEYEIEHGGPDAGGEAKVEQAWLDFLIADWVNARFGAVIVPFGRTNIYHDADLRDLTSRSLVARDVIPTTWTESGAGLHGEFNPVLGDYEDLVISYETYVLNGLNDGFSDTGLSGAKGSLESDNNHSKAVVSRIVLSPALGHEVGLSGYWGRYNGSGDAITGGAVDFLSTWGPLELTGEYAYFDVEIPAGMDIADMFQGYSLQANYHFWFECLDDTFLGRKFDDPTFTLIGRYDWAKIDDDADVGTVDNEEDRYTLGLNYRPLESWVLKVEYQWTDTKAETLESGENDGWIASVAMGF